MTHEYQQNTTSDSRRVAQRTCIGCRQIAPVTVLVRVVVLQNHDDSSQDHKPSRPYAVSYGRVVVDAKRSLPGRGAWLHLDHSCLIQAERRKAFGRALRVRAVEVSAVHGYFAEHLT